MRRVLTIALAASFTAVAVALAVASAWQRAEAGLDRALLALVATAIVLAVHLLPAVLRMRSGWLVWPTWTLCLAAALWGHAGFFTSAWQGAAEARTATSAQARAVAARRAAIEADLAMNKARPVAAIARHLAWSGASPQADALRLEMQEAQRAVKLRDELLGLTATTAVTPVTDPVTERVTALTGWTPGAISLAASTATAVLIEVLGMLLWVEALRADPARKAAPFMAREAQQIPEDVSTQQQPNDLDRLRMAVQAGECPPKVTAIREFLGCSQARALQLRRELSS